MIESAFNVNKIVNDKKQQLIEAFVMFYGEEEREVITQKFNSTPFIGYLSFNDVRTLLNKAQEESSLVAEKYFFDKVGITDNIDIYKERLLSNKGFASSFVKIKDFYRNYNPDNLKPYALDYLKKIVDKSDLTWDDPNIDEYVSYALSFKEAYEEATELYESYLNEKYDYLIKCVDQCENIRKEVKKEVEEELIQFMYTKLSDEDKKLFDSEKSEYKPWYKMKSSLLFGNGVFSPEFFTPSDYFTTKSEEELNNPETPEYQIKTIKDNRLEYFKKMTGLSFESYEQCMDNQEVKAIIPDKALCDEITKKKERLKIKTEKLYIEKNPLYADFIKTINDKNYLLRFDLLTDIILNSSTCVVPNFVENSGQIELSSTVFIKGDFDPGSFDCRVVHECNHLYEAAFTNKEGSKLECTVGWDKCIDDMDEVYTAEYSSGQKRPYEYFNEIINELIAQDITKIMHDNKVFICGDEKTAGPTSRSGYQMMAPLVINFYNYYKQDIIASRKNGDLSPIINKIGKENFEALNDLIVGFNERFGGFKIYAALNDLQAKKDTENSRDYYSYLRQSGELFEKMQAYSFDRSL